jgi:hypothetical protein
MKLKYEARKGTRINYRFMGITTFEQWWWYNRDFDKWEFTAQLGKGDYTTCQRCRSVKAFRRKLKKAPKGVEFIFVNRWAGHNVTGFGCA